MQDSIDKIIATHNLPQRIKSLVLRVAHRNIERLGLTNFDEQYRYIDSLVEKFEATYEDRLAIRLDSPIFGDERTWHDILPDRSLYEEDEGISLCEAVGTAHSFLSEGQRAIVHKFLQASNADGVTGLSVEDVIADFCGVKWRSEGVARLIEQDQRFRQPERRLIHVRLDDSPYLQWGARNYDGNPLDFWNRHIDVYGRFVEEGRTALFRFDPGFYWSLRHYKTRLDDGRQVKQIDLAIPLFKVDTSKRVDSKGERAIVEAHARYNGSAYQAVRELSFSSQTILRYWRKHSLPILGRGENPAKTLEEEKQQSVVAAHGLYFGNAREAARALGYSKTTVTRYWRKAGLEPKGHGVRNLYSADLRRKVLNSYEFYDGSAEVAARGLGVSATNVRRVWRRNGLKAKGKCGWPKGVSRQEMKEAV